MNYPSKDVLREILSYNKETGVFVWKKPRRGIRVGQVAGYASNNGKKGYWIIRIDGFNCYAHRLAFIYMKGVEPPDQVDHIDGNGLNNKLSNLRLVSVTENKQNQKRRVDNFSGCTGVSFNKGAWRARIVVNKKEVNLGRFKSKIDAEAARKSAEKHYGFHKNHGSDRPIYE